MATFFSKSPCTQFGCATDAYCRGLCKVHYDYHRNHGTLETAALPPAKRGRKPKIVAVPVFVELPPPVFGYEYKPAPKGKCEYEHLLGKVSDALIAEVYGIDRSSVSQLRRKRGILAMTNKEAYWTGVGFRNFLASQGCTTQ